MHVTWWTDGLIGECEHEAPDRERYSLVFLCMHVANVYFAWEYEAYWAGGLLAILLGAGMVWLGEVRKRNLREWSERCLSGTALAELNRLLAACDKKGLSVPAFPEGPLSHLTNGQLRAWAELAKLKIQAQEREQVLRACEENLKKLSQSTLSEASA